MKLLIFPKRLLTCRFELSGKQQLASDQGTSSKFFAPSSQLYCTGPIVAGHGRYTGVLKVSQPVWHPHSVTVVVLRGKSATHEQGTVTSFSSAQSGCTQTSVVCGPQAKSQYVLVMVGHGVTTVLLAVDVEVGLVVMVKVVYGGGRMRLRLRVVVDGGGGGGVGGFVLVNAGQEVGCATR
jgi:hypothetical protein